MLAGERRHRSGNGGHLWAQGIEAATPVVDMVSGVDGAAGGELLGGGGLGSKVCLGILGFPIKIE